MSTPERTSRRAAKRGMRIVSLATAMAGLAYAARAARRWHLRWGATDAELAAAMPGDDVIACPSFCATRAITIDAPPGLVWPWLVQIGFGRAGFYSYDRLDNLGRPSAERILPEYQATHVGDLAAPMANPPTPTTSFQVRAFKPRRYLVWEKRNATWTWVLTPLPENRTRLVTRLRVRHDLNSLLGLAGAALLELGDFPMMRKELLGIRRRAEGLAERDREHGSEAAQH